MATKTQKPTPIERPCSTCHHLHEGIPCMEDGCQCQKSTVAEIPPSAGPSPVDETIPAASEPEAVAHETIPGSQETFPGNPAVLFAGDATIQSRVGELLAAFEDLGEPVGC